MKSSLELYDLIMLASQEISPRIFLEKFRFSYDQSLTVFISRRIFTRLSQYNRTEYAPGKKVSNIMAKLVVFQLLC